MSLSVPYLFKQHRQSLLLSAQQWTWYQRKDQRVILRQFDNNPTGIADLSACLQQNTASLTLLCDLGEEEFVVQKLPALAAREQRTWLQQYQQRLFPGKQHILRQITVQKKPKKLSAEITADIQTASEVLFVTAGDQQRLDAGLQLLDKIGVRLGGICSIASATPLILDNCEKCSSHLLLLALHGSGLRESFLRAGRIRLSRLVSLPQQQIDAALLLAEMDKMRQYLHSLGLLAADQILDVRILADAGLTGQTIQLSQQRAMPAYRLQAAQSKVEELPAATQRGVSLADEYYLAALCKYPQNHFATTTDMHHYYRCRRWVWQSGVMLGGIFASAVVSSHQWLDYYLGRQWVAITEQRVQQIERVLTQQRQILPTLPASATTLRDAVLFLRAAEMRQSLWADAFRCVAGVLPHFVSVQVKQLQWQQDDNEATLTMEAQVHAATGDYQREIQLVTDLLAAIQQQNCVMQAELIAAPYSPATSGSLVGSAAKIRQDSVFRLQMQFVAGES